MPQPYDLTNLSAANDAYEITKASNQLIDGGLGAAMLIGTFLIFFLAFKGLEAKKAFAGAAFVTATAGMLFRALNLIPDGYMFMTFALAGVALIWLRTDS
jgi:hypothetical protein